MRTIDERFWSKVSKGPEEQCWEWQASFGPHGYGQFNVKGTPRPSHRVAFMLTHGRWPEPCALHRCDNRACVNPAHLFEGTRAENTADMMSKGRGRHATPKLTDQDVRDIRANAALCRVTQHHLATRYGVSQTHINRILGGSRRADVSL